MLSYFLIRANDLKNRDIDESKWKREFSNSNLAQKEIPDCDANFGTTIEGSNWKIRLKVGDLFSFDCSTG